MASTGIFPVGVFFVFLAGIRPILIMEKKEKR